MISVETLNKAIELTKKGNIKEAEALYLELLSNEPKNYIILSALGLFYINRKDFNNASKYLKKACEINKTFGNLSALGFVEYEQENYKESAKILEQSLKYGENSDIYNKLILSFFHIKDYENAIKYSAIMHQKYPKDINAISNMIKSLTQSGKLLEAEKLCIQHLKENQNSASLWFHLGLLKEVIYCDDKLACECYKMALELGSKESYHNIAVSYQKQKKYGKAEEYYKKMLEYNPNSIETKTSLGMFYLSQKKFKEGYELFFQRNNQTLKDFNHNFWQPNLKIDKEVVVIGDQGFGDHIQFIRYLPFLEKNVEKFTIATRNSLIKLFENNYPEYKFIKYDEINPCTQAIRITDLAYALNIDFNNIPFSEGYLKSTQKEIISNKLKVGLCWEAGNNGLRTMLNKSINIKLLEPFFNLKNVQIYSFQVNDSLNGNSKYPEMINLSKDFKDFEDTAQSLLAMDIVISVDTSVVHLAGALGVKTFLMLPYYSDWRWFNDTKTTPWYNSVEIFKQTDPISWEKPIEEIICRLKEYSS